MWFGKKMYQNVSFKHIFIVALHSDETSVWSTGLPTKFGFITYSLVIPMICSFGILANLLNFIIFSRPRMTATAYCYFTGNKKYIYKWGRVYIVSFVYLFII